MMGKMLDALTAPEGDTSKPNQISVTVKSTHNFFVITLFSKRMTSRGIAFHFAVWKKSTPDIRLNK